MPANTSAKAPQSEEQAIAHFGDDDLGRIQSILFGQQAEQTEHRLAQLEAANTEMVTRIAGELGTRISALETDLAHRHQLLEQRLTEAERTAARGNDQLRQKLKSQTEELRSEARAEHAELSKALDGLRNEIDRLRSETQSTAATKVDRSMLAEAFAATAAKLADTPASSKKAK